MKKTSRERRKWNMVTRFGTLNGRDVSLITIKSEGIEAELLDYGATLRSIRVRDRAGEWTDVCLGYDTPEEYAKNDGYLGAAIGRYANRIAGGRFSLNGEEYTLACNNGKNHLHGGPGGFHQKIWSFSNTEGSVTFSAESPDGEEGYPGKLNISVTYRTEGSGLFIDYEAVSDRDTIVNLTNHAYFNLGGHAAGPIYDHVLSVNADCYTPVGAGLIPTGELAPVEGTMFDLREGVKLDGPLNHPKLAPTGGFDHNFALNQSGIAAKMWSPRTGIGMEVVTTMEGLQIYASGGLSRRTGKGDSLYGKHHALCLETQRFPDSINQPNFPSPVLRKGERYCEHTEYRFFLE